MKSWSIVALIGLAGVAEDERPRARWWGRFFEVPMLLVALWILVEWYLFGRGKYPEEWETVTSRVILVLFVVETLVLVSLVRDKRRYLASNWINLLIIAVGLPLFFAGSPYAGALRGLRVLLLLGILVEVSSTVRQVLARNNVGLTLLVSLVVIAMAGISIAAIDPAVETPWDGIWWAWVTVTTVGYGDVVPESPEGRVFGGLLMVLGLGLFSLITASLSAFLISREEHEVAREEGRLIEREEEMIEMEESVIGEEVRAIERLERIEARLIAFEKRFEEMADRALAREAPGERAEPDDAGDAGDAGSPAGPGGDGRGDA